MNFTIGKKIAIGFSTVITGIIIISVINFFRLSTFRNNLDEMKEVNQTRTIKLINLELSIERNSRQLDLTKINQQIDEFISLDLSKQQEMNHIKESLQKLKLYNADEVEKKDKVLKEIENIVSPLHHEYEKKLLEKFQELHREIETNIIASSIVFSILILFSGIFSTFLTRSIVARISEIVEKLTKASKETTAAAEQLNNASQTLSSSASEQAASIEETTASLEEISAMIRNNLENSQNAFNLSNMVKENSEKGNKTILSLLNAMSEILNSNEKIKELVKVIGNIAAKTEIMDEIVFQTKLLSFNASVEAERAGEHGRGFAVVAQEVGNLAQISGNAAKEIADIVSKSVKDAEQITNENKGKVESGNLYVKEAAEILDQIMHSAKSVSEGAKQVLDASQEQSTGISQISSAMIELDKATQENSSVSAETASTSEELTEQIHSLDNAIQNLNELIFGKKNISQTVYQSPKSDYSRLNIKSSSNKKTRNLALSSNDNDSWDTI